jgi:hypothetical protein
MQRTQFVWHAILKQLKMPRSLSTGDQSARLEHSGMISVEFAAVVVDFIISVSSQAAMKRNVHFFFACNTRPDLSASLVFDDIRVNTIRPLY